MGTRHCEECGKAIAKERLEAMPSARTCFACSLKDESTGRFSMEDATAEHPADERTELIARPTFDDEESDEHTVQTDVSAVRASKDS